MNEELGAVVQQEARLLLDTHLTNLAERLFEVGKKADQQLTAWLTFSALTVLLCFGAAGSVSIGGLELTANVAAAVTYALSCAFYYRATLSMGALELWRNLLKDRRKVRFGTLLQFAKGQGPTVEEETLRDVNAFVSEYPGYLACNALIKYVARKQGGVPGLLVPLVNGSIVGVFSVSPYLLAGALLYKSEYSLAYIAIALLGIVVCVAGNVIVHVRGSVDA